VSEPESPKRAFGQTPTRTRPHTFRVHCSKGLKATLALTFIVTALVLVSSAQIGLMNRTTSPSSGLRALGWYSSLTTLETKYCLKPTGVNSTLTVSSTENVVMTNLTAITTGICSTAKQHWGLAAMSYVSGVLDDAILSVQNNTTVGTPKNFTYLVTYDPVVNPSNVFGTSFEVLDYNVTPSKGTAGIFQTTCIDCGGGGGGGGGGGTGTIGGGTQGSGSGSCPTGGSPLGYTWDSVCFQSGYPLVYPHPNMVYYGLYPIYNYFIPGNQLLHNQIGSVYVGSIGQLGPVIVGAVIGAFLGLTFGGPWGALAGAIIGAVVSAVLVFTVGVTYQDESGAIWFWINNGFATAMNNVPWYVYLSGPAGVALYLNGHLNELRIGNTWYINANHLTGP
jgi:hypothetical protein